jgi:hypothetical protein
MKINFKIALQVGLIGAIAIIVIKIFAAKVVPYTYDLIPIVSVLFPHWLFAMVIGALYVYVANHKGNEIRVREGVLGGAVSGFTAQLVSAVVGFIILRLIVEIEEGHAGTSVETIAIIIAGIAVRTFLSVVGGTVYATLLLESKGAWVSILRFLAACVLSFVAFILGDLGVESFFADANAQALGALPVALILLSLAWVIVKPRSRKPEAGAKPT